MSSVLLGSKVRTPPVVPHHVARSDLIDRFDAQRRSALTVVTAPAGYGKSALLAAWAAGTTDLVSWLRLDAADNDPAVFARYIVEAVRVVAPDVAHAAVEAAEQRASPSVLLDTLIEGVRASGERLVTVIDDLHRISEPAVMTLCSSTVDALPGAWRWIIGSRIEPAIGLARRRLDGSLTELSEDDLRFNDDDAFRLITQGLGVAASQRAVRTVTRRVDGWAAGLCMAGLAAQAARDPDAALLGYSGRDRHLGRYFAEEVFAHLPDRLQEFLLDTSILHVVQPDLCDAVTGGGDAAPLIADAANRRLYIAPVDEGGRDVFEYHDLFSEWLNAELARRMPGRGAELRRRAAEWCLQRDMPSQAVRYALDAADWTLAGEIIRQHGYQLIQGGFSRSVLTWVTALPDIEVRRALDLALLGGDAAVQAGDWPTVARLADLALTADTTTPAGRAIQFGGLQLAWFSSLYAGTLEDMQAITAAIDRLVEQTPADSAPHHQGEDVARALALAALARYFAGGLTTALDLLGRARRSRGTLFSNLVADGLEALIWYERGETSRAAALAREGHALASGVARPPLGAVLTSFAVLWTADGRAADDAADVLRNVVDRAQLPQADVIRAICDTELNLRAGRYDKATRSLALAERLLEQLHEPRFALRFVNIQATRLKPPGADLDGITDRESDVLRLLSSKLTRREIAAELGISIDTVKTHTRRIYRKLDVSNRADAVRRAQRRGIA